MAAPVITARPINNLDGTTCNVSLDRTLGAGAAFYANRTPDVTGPAVASFVFVSGTTYKVTVKSTVNAARELWYITAADNQGNSNKKAVWIRLSTNDIDVNEIGKKLEEIIIANQDGIEAAMAAVYTNATLKSVTYGGGWRNDRYLHIVINPASVDEEYWAAPFYKLDQIRFSIEGFIVHENDTMEVNMVTACGRSTHMILGQQAYETFTTASGLIVSGIQGDPVRLQLFDQWDETLKRFIGGFTFEWKGEWAGGGVGI